MRAELILILDPIESYYSNIHATVLTLYNTTNIEINRQNLHTFYSVPFLHSSMTSQLMDCVSNLIVQTKHF